MVELTFQDGTVDRVERCFTVSYPGDPDGEQTRHVAQRRPGSPLQWLVPEALADVKVEMPDGQYTVAGPD